MHRTTLTAAALIGLVLLVSLWTLSEPDPAAQSAGRDIERVIILGIDGVDYRLLSDWMDEGLLPNFRRMRWPRSRRSCAPRRRRASSGCRRTRPT